MLGNIFTHEMKPMEVEILVAEVGLEPAGDQMFHILYDGTVVDARDIARDRRRLPRRSRPASPRRGPTGSTWPAAIRLGVAALAGADREIPPSDLEVAELCRGQRPALLPPPADDALQSTALV